MTPVIAFREVSQQEQKIIYHKLQDSTCMLIHVESYNIRVYDTHDVTYNDKICTVINK